METSRKRFSENDDQGNKRKSRRSKRKSHEEKIVSEEEIVGLSTDCQDADTVFSNELNNSGAITLHLIQACNQPYSEADDKKIIKYFQENMNFLNMKDDISVYHILKTKYLFQRSAKSLQSRFLNDILPNLFKYNFLNHSDMIDFYDAAKLELPEEFIKILDSQEATNKKSKNTSRRSTEVACAQSSTTKKKCIKQKVTNKENVSIQNENIAAFIPDTFSRQFDEVDGVQASTLEEKCLKSILGFILLNNSKGDCVYIPDTEPNVPSIEKRLLDEFGIRQDSIKIIPKFNFDTINKLKDTFDMFEKLECDVLKNHIHDEIFIERMLPDVRKLLEFMEKSKSPPDVNSNETQFSVDNAIFSEIDMNSVGQLIANLSDSFDHVSISSNTENQECNSVNKNVEEIKTEPVYQDDVETVVRSHYFVDHTYCKDNSKNVTETEAISSSNNLAANERITNLQNNLIESACIPQIMFSKRSQDKIVNENINVDHLIMTVSPKTTKH